MVLPHWRQAERNHSQTLERLQERGGLSPSEILAVLEDRPWTSIDADEAVALLARKLEEYEEGAKNLAVVGEVVAALGGQGPLPCPAGDADRPEIVCLCGSSRFVAQMAIIAWALERDEGKIVFGLHLLPDNYPGVAADHQAEKEDVADKMDELHLRKIDLADRVLVVNVGGYIGESTSREIEYAKKTGKPVAYLE